MPTKPRSRCTRCKQLHDGTGACAQCKAKEPRASTAQRGYGAAHQAERERWRPIVEAGTVECARCGLLIDADAEWDLDHDDHDRSKYNGPAHMLCNRGAGGVKGAAVTNAKREW